MGFENALKALKEGKKIKRKGWNGNNQYLIIGQMKECVLADGISINPGHNEIGSNFIMFVGTSGYQCGWLASQADMLAEDWVTE